MRPDLLPLPARLLTDGTRLDSRCLKVWTQLDRIAVRQAGGGEQDGIADVVRPLVLVLDEDLIAWRNDRSAVQVTGSDEIRYDDLVGAMDVAYGAGLHDVMITSL